MGLVLGSENSSKAALLFLQCRVSVVGVLSEVFPVLSVVMMCIVHRVLLFVNFTLL